jgi:hypothetical protein
MVYSYLIRYCPGWIVVVVLAGGAILGEKGVAWASVWESYSAAVSKPAPTAVPRTNRQPYIAVDDPRFHAESFFGYPRRQDPLFDRNPKPSWRPMIVDKPLYDEPAYAPPDCVAPSNRLDPIRKPIYDQPLAILPNDDKPRYNFRFVEAPAYLAPTYNEPTYRAPNYVIRPIIAPSDERPAYDESQIMYNSPEYKAPVYQQDQYMAPREVAPPAIKPPE